MIRRLAAALWSLTLLAVLLVGIPAALWHYLWPLLPHHWPSSDQWTQWQQHPPRRLIVTALAAGAGWALWAVLVYAIIVDLTTRTRRFLRWLPTRRLPPLPTPIQATASGMIGATLFGMPAGTAHPPAPSAPAEPVAAAAATTASPGDPTVDVTPTAVPDRPPEPGDATATAPTVIGERGVQLPDDHGWLPGRTAQAVNAAAAAVWLRRRRRYRPRPIAGPDRDDPDLTPLPATVTTVQAILDQHDHPDDTLDPDATAPVGAHAATPATTITPAGLPIGGAGLVGPGAHAAARGLLTATLLKAATGNQPAQVIMTAADLATLVGPARLHAELTPALTIVADLQKAIDLLERHALDRARETTKLPALAATQKARTRAWPSLVLLAQAPTDPTTQARLALALLCNHLGITGALLGAWPPGQTWHVDAHGHTRRDGATGEASGRLCVLSSTATTDLLTLIDAADTDPPDNGQPLPPTPRLPQTRPPTHPPVWTPQAHTTAALRIQLLGPPGVYRTDPAATPVPIQRSAALQALLYLAIHPHGATTTELLNALWPGPRPTHAPNRLYTPLAALRTTLRDATGVGILIHDGDRYRLDPQHLDVDLWQLHTAAHQVATANDPDQREQALQTVTNLYRGELAHGKTWPWITIPREATRRLAIDAYTSLADNAPDPALRGELLRAARRVDPVNTDLRHRIEQPEHI